MKNKTLVALGAMLAALFVNGSYASDEAAVPVDVQVFKGPEIIRSSFFLRYPEDARFKREEGWVQLNFMVDPAGKVYEPTIVESAGNPLFEEEALRAISQARFTPAKVGKTPVTSSQVLKVRFDMPGTGAGGTFVKSYKALVEVIARSDRAAADQLLASMAPKNLYESAYQHLGRYGYYQKWGTDEDQLTELRRAVAYENRPGYLPKKEYVAVMGSLLLLELKMHKYGSALATWEALKPYSARKDVEVWQRTMDKVEALRRSDASVRVREQIVSGGSWHGRLFKNHYFELVPAGGRLSEIKLRCKERYLLFQYQAGVRYELQGGADRKCFIEVIGDPGTKFDLIES